jgi:hypothetical protein
MLMQRQQVSRADRSIELSNSHRAHPTEETRVAFLSRVFTARKRIKARQRKHGSPSFVLVLLRRHTPHADDENEKATARLRVKRRHLCACAREGSLWPSRCMHLPCRAVPCPGPGVLLSAVDFAFTTLPLHTALDAEIDHRPQCRSLLALLFRRRKLGSWLEHVQRGAEELAAARLGVAVAFPCATAFGHQFLPPILFSGFIQVCFVLYSTA